MEMVLPPVADAMVRNAFQHASHRSLAVAPQFRHFLSARRAELISEICTILDFLPKTLLLCA